MLLNLNLETCNLKLERDGFTQSVRIYLCAHDLYDLCRCAVTIVEARLKGFPVDEAMQETCGEEVTRSRGVHSLALEGWSEEDLITCLAAHA